MSWDRSIVAISTEADRTTSNNVTTALGHGNSFVVALSASGLMPATHWGCHYTMDALMEGDYNSLALSGADIAGLTKTQVKQLFSRMIWSARSDIWGRDHFDAVLAANGLKEIPER